MNCQPEPVARVFRGDIVESIHSGSIAVVDADGRLLYLVGDPYFVTYLRSSAKPFQAIAVVESSAARKFGFTSEEIAVIAGSHSGEKHHIDTVKAILEKIHLSEDHLKCGVHVPHRYAAMETEPEPGARFTPIEHNCSGKHAGMLAMAVFMNVSVEDYLSPSHPVQQRITRTIADICQYPQKKIAVGMDGCGAPVHALPLYNIALGYARLVSPASVPKEKAKAYSTVSLAMREHPCMVSGTARFDMAVSQADGETVIAKAGAEGLECFSFVDRNMGAAVKITDGARRALYPVSVELLYKMRVKNKCDGLKRFHKPAIKNHSDMEVGYIQPGFELKEAEHE